MRNVKSKAMKLDLRKPLLFMIALAVATVFTLTALAEKPKDIEPVKTLNSESVKIEKRELASVEEISVMVDQFLNKMDKSFAILSANLEKTEMNLSTN